MFAVAAIAGEANYDDAALIDAFGKTVFGVEYDDPNAVMVVRKFQQPARVGIDNRSAIDRTAAVSAFVSTLQPAIHGLTLAEAGSREPANFRIYVVDRKDYGPVIRGEIYRDPKATAPGRCFVRVLSSNGAIARTDVVIVSDEGEFLFQRCLVEEVLQGLGPLNDSDDLADSVFNDDSRHAAFTLHDRLILNMLYDPRIKAGMTSEETETLLPFLLPEIRARLGDGAP